RDSFGRGEATAKDGSGQAEAPAGAAHRIANEAHIHHAAGAPVAPACDCWWGWLRAERLDQEEGMRPEGPLGSAGRSAAFTMPAARARHDPQGAPALVTTPVRLL